MYTEKQRQMRRCKKLKKDGTQCKAYARVGGEHCTLHSYNHHRTLPKKNERGAARVRRAKKRAQTQPRAVCNCSAFPFTHRLSSGGCRFPDEPTERYESAARETKRSE